MLAAATVLMLMKVYFMPQLLETRQICEFSIRSELTFNKQVYLEIYIVGVSWSQPMASCCLSETILMLAWLKQLVLHVAGTLWAHLSCAPRGSWEDLQNSSFKQCQDLLLSIPPLPAPDMASESVQDQNIHSTEDRSWLGLLWSFPNIGDRLLLPWTLRNLGYRWGKARPMPALTHKWSNSKTPRPHSLRTQVKGWKFT